MLSSFYGWGNWGSENSDMLWASQASTGRTRDSNSRCVTSHFTTFVVCSMMIIAVMCVVTLDNLPDSFVHIISQWRGYVQPHFREETKARGLSHSIVTVRLGRIRVLACQCHRWIAQSCRQSFVSFVKSAGTDECSVCVKYHFPKDKT